MPSSRAMPSYLKISTSFLLWLFWFLLLKLFKSHPTPQKDDQAQFPQWLSAFKHKSVRVVYPQNNPKEVQKFLTTYYQPRLDHEETENLNRLITNKELESVIKQPPNKLKSRTRWLHWWILLNILKRFNSNPSQMLPKKRRGRNTSKLIYEASITPIPRPDKDTTRTGQYSWWT